MDNQHTAMSGARLPKLMPKSQRVLLPVVLASAAINSITMGYDTMMMSSLIAIPQFTNFFDLNPTTNGLMNASMWMGFFSVS